MAPSHGPSLVPWGETPDPTRWHNGGFKISHVRAICKWKKVIVDQSTVPAMMLSLLDVMSSHDGLMPLNCEPNEPFLP